MALIVAVAAVLGLLIGSFLNVVVWRVPRGQSIVRPPSACPACGHAIRPWDNVPVMSWLVLRGRCRDCGAPISVRYPAVEAGTGLAFALVTAWAGLVPELPALLYLTAVGIALALIDLELHRLPDAIVLPSIGVGLVLLALASALSGDWGSLVRAVAGGAILFALYFVIMLVSPRGMGFGDVKLAALLGLYLGSFGWGALVVGGFAAFVLGGIYGTGLILLRRGGRKTGVPFGPWMLLGAAVGIVVGPSIWSAYLSAMGL